MTDRFSPPSVAAFPNGWATGLRRQKPGRIKVFAIVSPRRFP
jgi:hypothetical protein